MIMRSAVLARMVLAGVQQAGESLGRLLHAVAGGYLTWVRRHPLLVDGALVALLTLISRHGLTAGHALAQIWSGVLAAGLLLPLVWRRRAPLVVFLLIAAAALAQWVTDRVLPADLALLVAFYTVAAYEPLRRVLFAAVVLEAGAVLAAIRLEPPGAGLVGWVLVSGLVAAAGFVGYNIRTRRAYLSALEDRAARLERDRDQEAQLAASAERARIAREMHDIVAHNLAVMIALADGAAYTAEEDLGQATTLMSQVADTGRAALSEMRRLLDVMRGPRRGPVAGPAHAPQPTLTDLDELLAAVRTAGLPTRLTLTGSPQELPPSAQLALYRMIQESLTNTLKHASATRAHVRLTCQADEARLEVTDDGQGRADFIPGYGLAGMRERAAVFGGQVSAGPMAAGGWRVHAVLRVGTDPLTSTDLPSDDPVASTDQLARTEPT
jgi:signal transduction histidine kinase